MPRADLGLHFITYRKKLAIAWCEGFDDIRQGLPESSRIYARARQYLAFKKCMNLRIDLKFRALDTC